MNPSALLVSTIFLPLAGAVLLGALAPLGRRVARTVALIVTLLTLLRTGFLIAYFPADGKVADGYAVTDWVWLGGPPASLFDIRFSVGLDGLGLWLFGLTALLMVTSVLVSWESIEERAPLFYGMLLLLEFGCLGVFAARDIILFYVFFEFTLIPLFFLIGIWGSDQRRYAAMKFFLFTLAGSVLTFLGLLAMVLWDFGRADVSVLRFSIPALTQSLQAHPIQPFELQLAVFVALFAGFAIKVPLFPFHTWLPLAHTEAPTAGSVFLAGVLLKIGTYGFVRFSLPMLPEAAAAAMPWVLWLAVIGIVYGALVALAQSDIKRLIAYSSVSHLGFCMLGLFAFNHLGIQGGTLQMVNHGLSTGALFALVGMLYERYHTREIRDLGGLARRVPWLAFFVLVFTLSSVGLPGLNGFVGEWMVLLGAFQRAWTDTPLIWQAQMKLVAVFALSGVVLGAWYMLWLVQRVFFGPLKEPLPRQSSDRREHAVAGSGDRPQRGEPGPAETNSAREHGEVHDLSWREVFALAPLAVFVLWIGVQPKFFLDRMEPTLNGIAASVQEPLRKQFRAEEEIAVSLRSFRSFWSLWSFEAEHDFEPKRKPPRLGTGQAGRS